jgi:hypothetical protein
MTGGARAVTHSEARDDEGVERALAGRRVGIEQATLTAGGHGHPHGAVSTARVSRFDQSSGIDTAVKEAISAGSSLAGRLGVASIRLTARTPDDLGNSHALLLRGAPAAGDVPADAPGPCPAAAHE